MVAQARADRAFLRRAVRYLAARGHPPVPGHRHRAAHRGQYPSGRPAWRPVPGWSTSTTTVVLAHARALLTSTPEGACDYIQADPRDPVAILTEAARTLDFAQPVALMLLGVLHHIPGTGEAYEIVRRLVAALAPGSLCEHQPLHQRRQRRSHGGGGGALEPGRHAVDDLAHPAADRPVFRRPGPAATGGGVVLTLAPPPHLRTASCPPRWTNSAASPANANPAHPRAVRERWLCHRPPSGLHGAFAVRALTRRVLDVTEPLSSEEVEA